MASTDAWRLEGVLEREGVPTLPRLPAHAPKQPDPYPQSEAEPDLTATSFAAVADDSKVCMLRAARLAAALSRTAPLTYLWSRNRRPPQPAIADILVGASVVQHPLQAGPVQ